MRKYIASLCIGVGLFLIGITACLIETMNYKVNTGLGEDFSIYQDFHQYNINKDTHYTITNHGYNKNIHLYIDNSLKNEIKVEVRYSETTKVKINHSKNKKKIELNFTSQFDPEKGDFKKIFRLGIDTIKNKTIYNYGFLKQAEIDIYVNEDYRKNITFQTKEGMLYNPIR